MNRETERTPGGGLSRRAFLVQTGAAAALLKGGLRLPLAFAQEPVPGKELLGVRPGRPQSGDTAQGVDLLADLHRPLFRSEQLRPHFRFER